MSSHHSQKWFNLHHGQVAAGRVRRLQRQTARLDCFLTGRAEARFEYNCGLVFGFLCFSYTMFVTATYLGHII